MMPDSYGKGQAVFRMGYNAGIVFTLAVVFNYTKDLDPKIAWGIVGSATVAFSFVSLLMIKEPPDADTKRPSCNKFFKLVKLAAVTTFTNREIMLGYFNYAMT